MFPFSHPGSMFGSSGLFPSGQDPFAHMENMMASVFGHNPYAQQGGQFQSQMQGGGGWQQQQQPSWQQQQPSSYGAAVIEDVTDHPQQHQQPTRRAEPIVEEPEEDGFARLRQERRDRYTAQEPHSPAAAAPGLGRRQGSGAMQQQAMQQQGMQQQSMFGSSSRLPGHSAVFSSSSWSSGGPGGAVYSSSTSTRVGPNGVRETQSTVRDGRTGREEVTVARALGGRERVVTRTRDAQGHESANDELRGMDAGASDAFEEEWMQQAGRNLTGNTQHATGYGRPAVGPAIGGAPMQQQQQQRQYQPQQHQQQQRQQYY